MTTGKSSGLLSKGNGFDRNRNQLAVVAKQAAAAAMIIDRRHIMHFWA
jgi:hypothetical protein